MNRLSKAITTWTTLLCFAGSLLAPAAEAVAGECGATTNCAVVTVGGQTVTYPRATWTTVGTFESGANPGFSSALVRGDQAKVSLNQAAAQLGVSSSQIANVVSTLPSSSVIVFGRLSPLSGLMDITAIKLTRAKGTVTLSTSKFSPYMGGMWAAARTYMSPSEKLANSGPGPNPFAAYQGGDDEFHNIPQNGIMQAETILGLAARYYQAPIAYLNVANFQLHQWVTTSHHLFTTKTTEHTEGLENPLWYVGLPPSMAASDANSGTNICLDGVQDCPVPEHVVKSGLAWSDWSGGNLPNATASVHEFQVSHSGLNIIVIAAIIAVVSFGAFTAVAAAMGAAGAASSAAAGALVNMANMALTSVGAVTGTIGASAAVGAAIDGLGYIAVAAAVQGAGPFAADNLALSAPPTSVEKFDPQDDKQAYFQSIEGQAMTAPVGQIAAQRDATGNNGFPAFASFDQGYNTNALPSANANLQFNSMQYIQDTQ